MKIHIDDTIYEGSAAEIMDQFRLLNEHSEDFPSVEHYVRYIAARFTRTTGLPVALPETNEEEQAHEMLQILAYTNALEILEDASGAENAPEAVLQAENSAAPDRTAGERETGKMMKVRINGRTYEGSGVEIMEHLRLSDFDSPDQCPDTESYIRQMRVNFIRMTGRDCPLPTGDTERRAQAMLSALADMGALEMLESE